MLGDSFRNSIATKPMSGGLYDHGYDRNRFAKRFNEMTIELNGSSKPKVVKRKVNSLPFLVGV